MHNAFVRIQIGPTDMILWTWYWNFVFHESCVIFLTSWITIRLSRSSLPMKLHFVVPYNTISVYLLHLYTLSSLVCGWLYRDAIHGNLEHVHEAWMTTHTTNNCLLLVCSLWESWCRVAIATAIPRSEWAQGWFCRKWRCRRVNARSHFSSTSVS